MVTYRSAFRRTAAVLLLCVTIALMYTPAHSVPSQFSNGYTTGIFYRRLTNVQLTGNQRTDLVNVAMSQIGYTEANNKDGLAGLTSGSKNYTEYGLWYKNHVDGSDVYDRAAWCASFVSWCANQAGISKDIVTYHAYTPSGYNWFKANAHAYSRKQVANGSYTPLPGDIVYFKSAKSSRINHVGIVIQYQDGVLYTVEGNTNSGEETNDGGSVCLKSYKITNTFIQYICAPNYK